MSFQKLVLDSVKIWDIKSSLFSKMLCTCSPTGEEAKTEQLTELEFKAKCGQCRGTSLKKKSSSKFVIHTSDYQQDSIRAVVEPTNCSSRTPRLSTL